MFYNYKNIATCTVVGSPKSGLFASVETVDFGTFSYSVEPGKLEVFDEDMNKVSDIKMLRNVLNQSLIVYCYKHFYGVELSDIVQQISLERTLEIIGKGEIRTELKTS